MLANCASVTSSICTSDSSLKLTNRRTQLPVLAGVSVVPGKESTPNPVAGTGMQGNGVDAHLQLTWGEGEEQNRRHTSADRYIYHDATKKLQCGEAPLTSPLDISVISQPCKASTTSPKPYLNLKTKAPSFSPVRECKEAISQFGGQEWDGREGLVYQFYVSPGLVKISARDLSRNSMNGNSSTREQYPPRGKISKISSRANNRMLKACAEFDFSEMFSPGTERALVTLTYPGTDWEAVAPNGKAVAGHLEEFFRRFSRHWGDDLICLWKREFTQQEVPHFHLFLRVPEGFAGLPALQAYRERLSMWEVDKNRPKPRWRKPSTFGLSFEQWVRRTWVEVVNHPDPFERGKHEEHGVDIRSFEEDGSFHPTRIIAYLTKSSSSPHSTKGYQMRVPEQWQQSEESIGRTWGYRGLRKVVEKVQISEMEFAEISRVLRRMKRSRKRWNPEKKEHEFVPALKIEWRPRGPVVGYTPDDKGVLQPVQKRRKTRRRRHGMSHTGAGYALTQSGPQLAQDICHYLVAKTKAATPSHQLPAGMRGPITNRPSLSHNSQPKQAFGDIRNENQQHQLVA